MKGKRARVVTTTGWREMTAERDQFMLWLDPSHPDYPRGVLDKGLAEDFAAFDRDELVQAAAARIRSRMTRLPELLFAAVHKTGDLDRSVDAFAGEIMTIVVDAAAGAGPTRQHRRRLIYLLQVAYAELPEGLGHGIVDQLKERHARHLAPFQVVVNTGEASTFPQVYPHETAIILGRFPSSGLSKLGRIVNQSQELAGQVDQRGKGGRRSNDKDPDKAEQAKVAAKLHHWLGLKQTEIAALFGWDNSNPESIRERVRRAVRRGENQLVDELGPEWKSEPPEALEDLGRLIFRARRYEG